MTTLCGQLTALKIQMLRVKEKREEKVSPSEEKSSKHMISAERIYFSL